MKYLLQKDKKIRQKYKNNEISNIFSKVFTRIVILDQVHQLNFGQECHFVKKKNNFYLTHTHNRCISDKSIYRFRKSSRIKFKEFALKGYLSEVTKSNR
jgi:hypothetical protein